MDYVEVHNPLGEPAGCVFLLMYPDAFASAKRDLELAVGGELPTIVPTCFGPRSKFYHRKFESSEEIKVLILWPFV
jgi:hypothetical protein